MILSSHKYKYLEASLSIDVCTIAFVNKAAPMTKEIPLRPSLAMFWIEAI